MTEAAWTASVDPALMLRSLAAILRKTKSPLTGDGLHRRDRLFTAAVCRRLWPLLNEYNRHAVDLVEAYADSGEKEFLDEARRVHMIGWDLESQAAQVVPFDGPLPDRLVVEARMQAYTAVRYATEGRAAASTRAHVEAGWAVGLREIVDREGDTICQYPQDRRSATESRAQAAILRDIFGNPFRPVSFDPSWLTDTALSLARVMYETRDFAAMPILADALQEAGCEGTDILEHCRGDDAHVRGCWVIDLVLGKE